MSVRDPFDRPPRNRYDDFVIRFDDPVIQAAWEECQKPVDILPKPEDVTLGLLRWLIGYAEGPCPIDADEPDAHALYTHVWRLVEAIPGYKELVRRLNSELTSNLTVQATNIVRDRLSQCTGKAFADVDTMLITEVVGLPWNAAARPPAPLGGNEQPAAVAPSGSKAVQTPAARVLWRRLRPAEGGKADQSESRLRSCQGGSCPSA